MDWTSQVFHYCERGMDPGAWAEPVNAATNAAFVAVGLLALGRAAGNPSGPRQQPAAVFLAIIVVAIGIGSFLFHTLATRWARLADTAPIGVFMLAYLGYALRRFLALSWPLVAVGIGGFMVAMWAAADIDCGWLAAAIALQGPGRCFNGSLGYAPALAALTGVGFVLQWRRHPAAGALLTAAGVLLLSMALRTVDIELCAATRVAGHVLGTHFAWHLLNAAVLHLLLRPVTMGLSASRVVAVGRDA